MTRINTTDGLAKALEENDWSSSKSTDKVIAIMSGLRNVPWDKVKLFMLRWEIAAGIPVPNISLAMHDEGEEGEQEIDVDIPGMKEEE